MREMRLGNGKTVQICEHGAYPQTVAPESISQELEVQYQKNALKPTGKNYTFDSAELEAFDTGFTPRNHKEYMFNGKNMFVSRGNLVAAILFCLTTGGFKKGRRIGLKFSR